MCAAPSEPGDRSLVRQGESHETYQTRFVDARRDRRSLDGRRSSRVPETNSSSQDGGLAQRPKNARAASVLIYANPSSGLPAALKNVAVDSVLKHGDIVPRQLKPSISLRDPHRWPI